MQSFFHRTGKLDVSLRFFRRSRCHHYKNEKQQQRNSKYVNKLILDRELRTQLSNTSVRIIIICCVVFVVAVAALTSKSSILSSLIPSFSAPVHSFVCPSVRHTQKIKNRLELYMRRIMDVSFPCTFVPGNETTTQ